MISRRSACPVGAAALLFCLISIVCSIAYGQSASPAAPPAAPAPPPSASPGGAGSTAPAPSTLPAAPQPAPVAAPIPYLTMRTLDTQLMLGDGRRVWRPTRKLVGISLDNPSAKGTATAYTLDTAQARAYLLRIAPYVKRAPVRAHLALAPQYIHNDPLATLASSMPIPAYVVPAQDGAKLDIEASIEAIQQSLADDPTKIHIVLGLETIPVVNHAKKYSGINARIAHFVTYFNRYEVGRTETVRRAIDLVNGRFVEPGEVFSLNEAVGERTAQRGFGKGIVFVDGHLDTQLGGGMCQVATTLFNAVLLANLKVVERHPHVRTVPYVDPGADATVYWGQKDFKFKNDTKVPIYISYRTTASHAICDLYGKANPGVTVVVGDDYQRLGPRHYKAVLRRYVTANGHTKVDFETKSEYLWTPKLDYTF